MGDEGKTVEELLIEFHQLKKGSGQKIRKMPIDDFGNLLLDGNNHDDVEWYKNDENYDVIYEEKKPF